MAGRPALPEELHALKGTHQQRENNVIPLALVGGRPTCPKHLSKAARKEWLAAVKLLEARGTLEPGCGPTLNLYAVLMARWLEAKADIDARGLQIKTKKTTSRGEIYEVEIENPMLRIAQDSEAQLQQLTKTLGIAPDAREKVKKVKTVARAGAVLPAWYVPAKDKNDV